MSSKPSVLIVDDVEANLVALEAELGSLECDLVKATSGNEALRQLLKRPFAVMLLDVQMPEMDGFEVARYARENPTTQDVPIIFVTAMHETEENVLRGYGSGAVDLLFKPVNRHVLRSKVQVFLELYQGRRQLADEIESHKRTMAELEAFSYSVAHDLRAPLRSIDGFSQALLDDYGGKLEGQAKDFLARVRAASQRMAQLIDDLLSLSRLSRTEFRRTSVDLSALCRSIVNELRQRHPDRVTRFEIQDGIVVDGDLQLLRVALENLLGNASKFTARREGALIEFGISEKTDPVVCFVRDNGAGFDMTFAEKLFAPFQRLHSAAEFEGTGIGLATVRRVINRHGGKVWAEGRVGEGATFYFTVNPG